MSFILENCVRRSVTYIYAIRSVYLRFLEQNQIRKISFFSSLVELIESLKINLEAREKMFHILTFYIQLYIKYVHIYIIFFREINYKLYYKIMTYNL